MAKLRSDLRLEKSMIKDIETAKREVEKAKSLVEKVKPHTTSNYDEFSEAEWKQRRSTAQALSGIAEHTRTAYHALRDAGDIAGVLEGRVAKLVVKRAHELTHIGYADDRPVLGRAQVGSADMSNVLPENKLDWRTRPDKKELAALNKNLNASLKALTALLRSAQKD